MPTSNDTRVLSEGCSNTMATTRPSSGRSAAAVRRRPFMALPAARIERMVAPEKSEMSRK